MLTASAINSFARQNGIHAVGWFAASEFTHYNSVIDEAREYDFVYRPLAAFRKSGYIPDDIRTIIVLVMDYFIETAEAGEEAGYRLSNYSRACWSTLNPKVKIMSAFLTTGGYRAEMLDVPQRAAACRAGLGFIGRNTLFYAYGFGSYVGIASIGTDAEIEHAAPGEERVTHPLCRNCRRCITACPVAAISSDGYRINPLRCLSFVNRHPDEPGRILPENRGQLQNWLYGCETCQNVCPLNEGAEHRHEAVTGPEVKIEGMSMPNEAIVPRTTIQANMAAIRSPGYRTYVKELLGNQSA